MELVPAHTRSFRELADLFERGFEDYFVPIRLNAETLAERMRFDGVDLSRSCIARINDEDAAIVLIAPRGWSSRVAAMGVMKAQRGKGLGRAVLRSLMDEARELGERHMELECIATNERGLALYAGEGFERRSRLVGFEAEAPSAAAAALEAMDPAEFAAEMIRYGAEGLPFVFQAASLSTLGAPCRGYRLEGACCVIADPSLATVRVHGVLVNPGSRRQGKASRLLQAVFAQHPGTQWNVAACVPEGLTPGLFEGLGFRPYPLTQWHMIAEL